MNDEIRTDTEQPQTRRDVVRLGAALLATGLGLASLTGVAARENEPGDDRGGHRRHHRRHEDRRHRRRHHR